MILRNWIHKIALAHLVHRRCERRSITLCRRKADGSLWAASSPQNFGAAMSGIFSGKPQWHFVKVRIWQGVPIVAPRVFWSFQEFGLFEIVAKKTSAFWLPSWSEQVETSLLHARGGE